MDAEKRTTKLDAGAGELYDVPPEYRTALDNLRIYSSGVGGLDADERLDKLLTRLFQANGGRVHPQDVDTVIHVIERSRLENVFSLDLSSLRTERCLASNSALDQNRGRRTIDLKTVDAMTDYQLKQAKRLLEGSLSRDLTRDEIGYLRLLEANVERVGEDYLSHEAQAVYGKIQAILHRSFWPELIEKMAACGEQPPLSMKEAAALLNERDGE